MDTDRWLCFNDSSVSFVTFEEVKQNTFGTVIHEKQQQYFGESTSSLWPNEHEYYDNGTNGKNTNKNKINYRQYFKKL